MLDLLSIAKKETEIHDFVIKNATLENKNFNFFGEEDKTKLNVENPTPGEDEDFFQEPTTSQLYGWKYGGNNGEAKNMGYPWASDPNFKTNKEIIINLTNPYFSIREKMLIYNKSNSFASLWLKNIVQDQDEKQIYSDYEISSSFYIPESRSFGASRIRKSTNSMFPGCLALFFYTMLKKKMNKGIKTVEEIVNSCELSNFSRLYLCTKQHYKELDSILTEMEGLLKEVKSATINILLPSLFVFSGENLSLKLQIPKDKMSYEMQRVNPDKMAYRLNKANESYLDYISKYFISNSNLENKYAYPRYIHLYRDGSTKSFYLAGKKPDGKAKFIDESEYRASGLDPKLIEIMNTLDIKTAMQKHLSTLDRNEHEKYLKLKEIFPKFKDIIKRIVVESYKKELLIGSL